MTSSFTVRRVRAALGATAVLAASLLPAVALGADLRAIDRNDDGQIGRAEYLNHLAESFFLADGNKDGRLTSNELKGVAGTLPLETFKAGDADDTGTLDIHEFQRILSRDFDAADTDKNGAINSDEFNRYFR